MIKKILKPFFKLLPPRIQNDIKYYRNKKERNGVIALWEKTGKPVPPPHAVKQVIIEEFQHKTGYQVLIETGTFFGDMMDAQRKNFQQLVSIELDETLHKNAVKRFKPYKNIKLLRGDSGKVLAEVVSSLKEPAIFWLDGHYSAGNTAMGSSFCPVPEELNAIFSHSLLKHVILIDDARDFVGKDGYPSIEEIDEFMKTQKVAYTLMVKDDVIRIVLV
jgi:hypothetical protein